MKSGYFLLLTGLLLPIGCTKKSGDYRAQSSDAAPLHAAMHDLTSVVVYDIFSPPQASRAYAYSSIAAYETLRQSHPEYRTLAGQLNGLMPIPAPAPDSEYYLPLSGVHAFMTVGTALTFSRARMDSLRTAMDERYRRTGIPDPVFKRSIAYGDMVAKHILAWAAKDSFPQTRGYPKFTVTSEPGRWAPTPPAYMDGVEPNWGRLRPFVMDSASEMRPKAILAFDTSAASPFFRQVREVYETRLKLTDEQRGIAAFWDCNPYVMHVQGHAMYATKKITPGGHWMGIAAIAAEKSGADIMKSAEAYARTAIAVADGFIAAWDEKYKSARARPETVINAYIDEQWEPFLQTTPFPEYPSGHSVISTAASTVLTDEFGPRFAFDDKAEVDYGLPVRSFSSFNDAAAEAAISRLYGGLHYRMSIDEGIVSGRKVGELVVQRIRTHASLATPRSATGVARMSANLSRH
jgi:hypothetical protein